MSKPVTGSEITPPHSNVIQGSMNDTNTSRNNPELICLGLIALLNLHSELPERTLHDLRVHLLPADGVA